MAEIPGSMLNENAMITALFDELHTPLHRYAVSLAHSTDQADDLLQETFSRAMANAALLARLDDDQCRAWLFRVLRNRFLDLRRQDRRSDQLVRHLANQAWGELDDPMIPLEWLAVLDDVPRHYREFPITAALGHSVATKPLPGFVGGEKHYESGFADWTDRRLGGPLGMGTRYSPHPSRPAAILILHRQAVEED